MKTTEIQDLINCIAKSGLEEVQIEMEGVRLHIKRYAAVTPEGTADHSPPPAVSFSPSHQVEPSVTVESPVTVEPSVTGEESSRYIKICAPLVGTFYRSSTPEVAPFVQEGDALTKGKKVCIIEAMKLYNEIEADVTGKIVKILVEDASPVEYDQPLFLIDPS
ncbi:acetyl-CoA carboxylase biotin carboxyl carrier protein [Candidatus Cardinium hertigii]|uniref:Biotin carboxyl carrier protein of acetyl-CoA carboxylase n=1 Tax=Candidatus Cardinium hertigii TaxID=247481 RepID=A0A2Z3L938_9BACT|nr:acetyl-CoA carboxylase biotin carboxyl carrier protein [Candidatus Cardinium hertigii]AWN81887.1 Biotin carboxyl carrier protein of acetyl-CoA carboxylase [Candidatus Cardinium hertigii]